MIFSCNTYREALLKRIESEKKRGNFRSLAEISLLAKIDKSYFTNVFRNRGDFNADQLYSLSTVLGFKDTEIDYLQLLLEFERSAHADRKKQLRKKINQLKHGGLKSEKHLRTTSSDLKGDQELKYHSSPFYQLIHFALAFEKYAREPQLLAKCFRIDGSTLTRLLRELEEMGLIKWNTSKKQYEKKTVQQHLSEDSPLLLQNQLDLRLFSTARIRELPKEQKYVFNATFSAGKDSLLPLKELFLDFIKKAQEMSLSDKSEQLYQLNLDLFPWLDA